MTREQSRIFENRNTSSTNDSDENHKRDPPSQITKLSGLAPVIEESTTALLPWNRRIAGKRTSSDILWNGYIPWDTVSSKGIKVGIRNRMFPRELFHPRATLILSWIQQVLREGQTSPELVQFLILTCPLTQSGRYQDPYPTKLPHQPLQSIHPQTDEKYQVPPADSANPASCPPYPPSSRSHLYPPDT